MPRNLAEVASDSGFASEVDLVSAFLAAAQRPGTPWRIAALTTEFPHDHGRTDVIFVDTEGLVVAFEAKIEKWRVALHQAYRNTALAHLSYVVVPERVAVTAASYGAEFAARGVGLCSVVGGEVVIHCAAELQTPLQPWLAERAVAAATKQAR